MPSGDVPEFSCERTCVVLVLDLGRAFDSVLVDLAANACGSQVFAELDERLPDFEWEDGPGHRRFEGCG